MSITQDIIEKKVFLGHPKNYSNPKTRDSWIGVRNGMVILNPETIASQIETAKSMFADAKKANKQILVICEKEMFKQELEELGEKQGFHYMNHKIPAGVLTNFDTLLSRIKSLQTMRDFVGSPLFESLTKKEQSMKRRQLAKIEKVYKGVVNLRKRPDLVIIIDGQMMHKFVEEVEILSIPAVVLSSTDFDMYTDCHLVHCNVNNTTSIRYVLEEITS